MIEKIIKASTAGVGGGETAFKRAKDYSRFIRNNAAQEAMEHHDESTGKNDSVAPAKEKLTRTMKLPSLILFVL